MTSQTGLSAALLGALQAARRAEKEQALFYRALAAEAEERGDAVLSERFNELHADEQHHVSRLTARLLELGAAPDDVSSLRADPAVIEGWEVQARAWETEALLREILDTERHHAEELGGKWTLA